MTSVTNVQSVDDVIHRISYLSICSSSRCCHQRGWGMLVRLL